MTNQQILQIISSPGILGLESGCVVLKECLNQLRQNPSILNNLQDGDTIWHLIASWNDVDWMIFQLGTKEYRKDFTGEKWLSSIYFLGDESVRNHSKITPYDIAKNNHSWPHLIEWWDERRAHIEKKVLFSNYGTEGKSGKTAL